MALDGALLRAGVDRALHTGDGGVPGGNGQYVTVVSDRGLLIPGGKMERDRELTKHGKSRWAQTELRRSGGPAETKDI